jgi:hypothetical protein
MKKLLAVIMLVIALCLVWYIYIKNPSTIEVTQTQDLILNDNLDQTKKDVTNNQVINSENPNQEVFRNQPGQIMSLKNQLNGMIVDVDILSRNTKWLPGVDGAGQFFINQDPKIRNLNITPATRSYICGLGPDINETTADVLVDIKTFIEGQNIINKLNELIYLPIGQKRDNYPVYYFDINGSNIGAIYEQCLP